MDTKLTGSPVSKLQEMVDRANSGRQEILDYMLQTIGTPRAETNEHAPLIKVYKIDPTKVRTVIGPGGSTITKLIEEAGDVNIDFEDDGTTYITANIKADGEKARSLIQ